MPSILKFKLDLSGTNLNNLVTDEIHDSIDVFSKVLVPVFGNYFTESLVVTNSSDVVLQRDTDYACIEFNQTQSLKTGKEICSAILILNNDIAPFKITYQVLGGDVSFSNKELLDAYNSLDQSNGALLWEEIENLPKGFKPKYHLHDIEEIYGFEYIFKTLVRVKKAIEVTNVPKYKSLLSYIDFITEKYKALTDEYLENKMPSFITSFLAGLNKVYFDIDKLANLTTATELDGEKAGEKAFTSSDLTQEKYLVLESLVGLKKSLFKTFIEKKFTGIGLTSPLYATPERFTLQQLKNSSTVTLISQLKAREELINTDEEVYSTDLREEDEVTIQKITNNTNNNGGVFVGINQAESEFYLGAMSSIDVRDKMTWKKSLAADQPTGIKDVLAKHITDYGNPHEVNQEDVDLDLVENLPVVDKEDMLALKSVHKYLTFDALIFFMRAFLLQNGKSFAPTETSKNQFIIDNCVVVFTPAGIVCKTKCDVAPSAIVKSITLEKISQACTEGESFTIPNGTTIEGSSIFNDKYLTGTYSIDGTSEITQAIKHFSQCCGYDEPVADFELNLSDIAGRNSESVLSNLIPGSYFSIEASYPEIETDKLRMSGIYPEDFISFSSGYNLGNIIFQIKSRYFIEKTAIFYHKVDVLDDDKKFTNQNKAYLFIDRKYIYEGSTANAELCLDRAPDQIQTRYEVVWRRKETLERIYPTGFPTLLETTVASQRFIKESFVIPFTEEYNNDSIFAEVRIDDFVSPSFTIDSNSLTFIGIKSTKVTRTIPLFVDGVQNGEILISRENETGRITIENIEPPTAQNTSHVYFLRNGGLTGSAGVAGVVDVWSDVEETTGWETPLPANI